MSFKDNILLKAFLDTKEALDSLNTSIFFPFKYSIVKADPRNTVSHCNTYVTLTFLVVSNFHELRIMDERNFKTDKKGNINNHTIHNVYMYGGLNESCNFIQLKLPTLRVVDNFSKIKYYII